MRKLALFLTLMMGVGFIAYEQQGLDTNDPLYPSPEAVFVDDDACGGSTITLLFDGKLYFADGWDDYEANGAYMHHDQINQDCESLD